MQRRIGAVLKLAYVAIVLAIASAGTINMRYQYWQIPLDYAETPPERPSPTLRTVWLEDFQKTFQAWYEAVWGLRGVVVRTDNTLNFWAFRQTPRPDHYVRIAKNDVFFSADDVWSYSRSDSADGSIEAAERIARVQRKLASLGKLLLPVVVPSKTDFYADAISSEWLRPGWAGRFEENGYGAFVRTLEKNHVTFLDARALLLAEAKQPSDIFPRAGRHWTLTAACHVVRAANEMAHGQVGPYLCEDTDCGDPVATRAAEEEADLVRRLNLWPRAPWDRVATLPSRRGGSPMPTLLVGSSFLFNFSRAARALDVFQPSLYYFYDSTVIETQHETGVGGVAPGSDQWRSETFSHQVFVLDMVDSFLPNESRDFLDEIEDEADRRIFSGRDRELVGSEPAAATARNR